VESNASSICISLYVILANAPVLLQMETSSLSTEAEGSCDVQGPCRITLACSSADSLPHPTPQPLYNDLGRAVC
jgi:hypothetical protein